MRFLFFIFLFSFTTAYAQPSDFIILKKKDRTVRSYYAGQNIEFISTGGAYRDALINKIVHDTLYIQEFLVRHIPTTLGFYIIDTAGSFRYAYHYNQIARIGKKQKGFDVRGSGAALMGGGAVLIVASGIVYLVDKEKFSPVLLGAAAGLGALGYLMSKSGSKGIVIGKHNYRIEYMKITADKINTN